MENYISSQLLVFGQSILLGLSVGLLYDLLRAFRLRLSYSLAHKIGCPSTGKRLL